MEHTQPHTLGDPNLYDFLINAPKNFRESERIKKFQLRNGDYIHCVLWNYHFYMTGTDIVKILIWRFQNAGRQIGPIKKFEEGVFSDLRNLKPGVDATLENPRSEFLEFLYKNGCIRTQKKQKVFFWYSVPHDALFFDALERSMRRDNALYAQGSFSSIHRDPAAGIGGGTRAACARQKTAYTQVARPAPFPVERHYLEAEPVGPIEPLGSAGYGMREQSIFSSAMPKFPEKKTEEPSSGARSVECQPAVPEASWLFRASSRETAAPQPAPRPWMAPAEFDDFDFGQFEFLRERYIDQFGLEKEGCRQKTFEESQGQKNRVAGRDALAEIYFVENKNHKSSE